MCIRARWDYVEVCLAWYVTASKRSTGIESDYSYQMVIATDMSTKQLVLERLMKR